MIMLSPVSYNGRRRRRRSRGWPDRKTGPAESSFKHWRGGNAADTAVILDRDGDGPVLLSDLGVRGWWRPVRHK